MTIMSVLANYNGCHDYIVYISAATVVVMTTSGCLTSMTFMSMYVYSTMAFTATYSVCLSLVTVKATS